MLSILLHEQLTDHVIFLKEAVLYKCYDATYIGLPLTAHATNTMNKTPKIYVIDIRWYELYNVNLPSLVPFQVHLGNSLEQEMIQHLHI